MDKKELNAVLRQDFHSFMQKAFYEVDNSQTFVPAEYLKIITDKLQQCAEKKLKRLIINLPPRKLKSHITSIAFPAWLLGRNPDERIVCISYSQILSNKFSADCRKLMDSDFFKDAFLTRLNPNKQTEDFFRTTKNGYRYSTSVNGSLTGIGGSYIIIDDPIKAADATSQTIRKHVNDWYDNTLSSRLDNKKEGVIIVVMQRLHIDDFTGHLLKQDGWDVLKLPAIADNDEEYKLSNGKVVSRKIGETLCPEIEPLDYVLNQKKTMTNYNFYAQYQQSPIPEKGNIIDFDKFGYFDEIPPSGIIYQSWDVAFKTGKNNDYSACITASIIGDKIHIFDIYRDKIDISNLVYEVAKRQRLFQAQNVIIESTTSTELLINDITKFGIYPIKYCPKVDKSVRANLATRPMHYGGILLKRNAPWLEDFKSEIVSFPNGTHDDQVDAFSQLALSLNDKSLGQNKIEMVNKLVEYNKSEHHKTIQYSRFKKLGLDKLF